MTRVAALTKQPTRPGRRRGPSAPTETATKQGSGKSNPALVAAAEVVTRYIPTEIVTAYVAVMSLVGDAGGNKTKQWAVFYVFLFLTPVLVWLFAAARARTLEHPLPWHPGSWPAFELVVATISFTLWAFTLPDTPFEDIAWYEPTQGAAALIVGSLVIGAIAPIYRPKQQTS